MTNPRIATCKGSKQDKVAPEKIFNKENTPHILWTVGLEEFSLSKREMGREAERDNFFLYIKKEMRENLG